MYIYMLQITQSEVVVLNKNKYFFPTINKYDKIKIVTWKKYNNQLPVLKGHVKNQIFT